MKLSGRDYALARLASGMAPFWRAMGDFETELVGRRLKGIAIDRPIFIAGLARSGTTILLEQLAQLEGVASHRYRDFPFLWTPVLWNWMQDRLSRPEAAVERPHGDRIEITKESPDAFEEPLWQAFFPSAHDPERLHVLDGDTTNAPFESFFQDHMRKILLIRKATRYVSKGNYNITRIAYLARVFPEARFLVPIRAPLAHVQSLTKQHGRFCHYAETDRRVGDYLRAAGHYEFGPQRLAINVTESGADAVKAAWASGDDARGYAVQWSEVYGHVRDLKAARPDLGERIMTVRFEDLCANPQDTLEQVLAFAELGDSHAKAAPLGQGISAPPDESGDLDVTFVDSVTMETAAVARDFGY